MRFLLVTIFVFPMVTHADPARTPDTGRMHTDDCAMARKQNKQCVLDMGEGEKIGGNAVTPNGVAIGVIETPPHGTLVRVRKEFIVEILKTAEDL